MVVDPSKPTKGPVFHDVIASDGSRMFLSFHSFGIAKQVWKHLGRLPMFERGAFTKGFDEVWLTFTYKAYEFSVHDHWSGLTFFAVNPDTPALLLKEIMAHFSAFE